MLKPTFFLDGINAKDYGVHLQSGIKFSEAQPIFSKEVIPGRNGDVVVETGAYSNRTGQADCFILQNAAYSAVGMANRFLLSKRGYRKLQASDDVEHYWLAMVKNGVEIENRGDVLIPFSLRFDCQPQRFLVDGENPIIMDCSGTVFNRFGFDALPKICVIGNGAGYLRVNDAEVEIKGNTGMLILDSQTQNAYNNYGNQNNTISAPTFPVLKANENVIEFSGNIEKIEIIPRWWEL